MSLNFLTTPPVGTMLMLDSQQYELTAVEPYQRRDGSASSLLVWTTSCPDCGAAFQVKTGLKCHAPNRRCDEHRAPLRKVDRKKGRGPGRGVEIRVIEPSEGTE